MKASPTLLDRLGGNETLHAAVDLSYGRLLSDDRLERFFRGTNMTKLSSHKYNFMRLAFEHDEIQTTELARVIQDKHNRLFALGLDETHFDMVAAHFEASLDDLGVDPALVKQAMERILPLRTAFFQGARDVSMQQVRVNDNLNNFWYAAGTTAVALVVFFFDRAFGLGSFLLPTKLQHTLLDDENADCYGLFWVAWSK